MIFPEIVSSTKYAPSSLYSMYSTFVSVIFIELAKIPSYFGFSEVAKAPKQLIKTNASIRTIQTVFFT